MKTLLKSLMAIALVATMLVASLIVVSAAEENIAPNAKYTIVRLTEGVGSAEEEGPAWVDPADTKGDNNFTRLNDGWNKPGESDTKSCMLAGSARTHRIKFDLGTVKSVSKVVLYMKDNYRRAYENKHASNRGYNKDDGFAVYSDAAATKTAKFTLSETEWLDAEGNAVEDYFIVTLTLKDFSSQYLTIDIQAELPGKHPEMDDDEFSKGAYVVSINEVEIFGKDGGSAPADDTTKAEEVTTTKAGDASTPATQGGDASTPATQAPTTQKPQTTRDSGTAKAGDSSIALIAIISVVSLAGAAVVLKKKSF